MNSNDKLLYKVLKSLLDEKLSEQEAQSLKDEGFTLKNPTRKAAVMAALYKKAAAGDLSAIKELRSIMSEKDSSSNNDNKDNRAVIIIDDIGN